MFYSLSNKKFFNKNAVHIKDNIIKYEDDFFKSDITYPIIYPLCITQYESIYMLNKIIRDDVNSFKSIIKTMMNEYKIAYKKDTDINKIKHQYEVYSDYEVNFNRNDIISISETFYEYSGGAHGMTYLHSYNYDINESRLLNLGDIFKEGVDYKNLLNEFISSEIKKNQQIYFDEEFKGITENVDFYLTDDSLVVYFQLYEIAPYVSGIRKFKLPYEKYSQYIKDKYVFV